MKRLFYLIKQWWHNTTSSFKATTTKAGNTEQDTTGTTSTYPTPKGDASENVTPKSNVQKESKGKSDSTKSSTQKNGGASVEMLEQLRSFIFDNYELRFNLISEQTECRRKGRSRDGHAFTRKPASIGRKWTCVDQRMQNTISLEALMTGINCWDRDVNRLLHSQYIETYNPIQGYVDELPQWDGTDRLTALALRLSDDELWVRSFGTWMRAMTAQWMNHPMQCANSLAPVLISEQQGMHKSTFCRLLLPPELSEYYLDRFNVNSQSRIEQRLACTALINMDEFDRFSPAAMASLKNIMQMQTGNFRKVGTSQYVNLHRTASFIATSNSRELLTDPSGSRRFMCINIEHPIDCSPIDHKQLYAQLKEEIRFMNKPTYLSKADECEWQQRNRLFCVTAAEEEAFSLTYRPASSDEDHLQLTCTEIITSLARRFPRLMKDIRPRQMSRTLQSLGVPKIHTRKGNAYRVVAICD